MLFVIYFLQYAYYCSFVAEESIALMVSATYREYVDSRSGMEFDPPALRHKVIFDKLTHNTLTTAKILLAHYRRLERYHLFFVEGRAQSDG